jgi:hypothetical protein
MAHDLSGLRRKYMVGLITTMAVDTLGLQCGHMEKDVASHAQPNRAAPLDAQMI